MWPRSPCVAPNQSSDLSLNPFARNRQLLKLIRTATQPITWKQFAFAIGLPEVNEMQSKFLLAETCNLLLADPPQFWSQYLYRFSPIHFLEGKAGKHLLSFLPKIPLLQRSTVDIIVKRMVDSQSWPSGETNSFLLLLAHSEEWVGLQTLTEIAWKLLDAEENQLASQLVNLLSNKNPYKSQIEKILEVKQYANSCQYDQAILIAGRIISEKGFPSLLKDKASHLLIQGLVHNKKLNLAWKVCEKVVRNVSPESNLDDWLSFQFTLCYLDIYFNRNDCAMARLVALEKVIDAQYRKHFQPWILQLRGEYYLSIGNYSQAKSNFNSSLEQFQMLRQCSRVREIKERLSKIDQE